MEVEGEKEEEELAGVEGKEKKMVEVEGEMEELIDGDKKEVLEEMAAFDLKSTSTMVSALVSASTLMAVSDLLSTSAPVSASALMSAAAAEPPGHPPESEEANSRKETRAFFSSVEKDR